MMLLLWWWWWRCWWCCSGGSSGGGGGVTGRGGNEGCEGCDGAVVIGGRDGGVAKVVVVVALLLFGSQFIHGTYKLPHKPCVYTSSNEHSAYMYALMS